eukprot:NODE_13226_length_1178_cov_2.045671.p1 GENE.NODE_13226_length_1178_cov_2.045671~~NODE_13226_length_1178_cov_2.045671.p1  ORF type:complete len:374 (-),score=105.88 NODE_13226_length_1178_cov_2.045671:14-1135(-)
MRAMARGAAARLLEADNVAAAAPEVPAAPPLPPAPSLLREPLDVDNTARSDGGDLPWRLGATAPLLPPRPRRTVNLGDVLREGAPPALGRDVDELSWALTRLARRGAYDLAPERIAGIVVEEVPEVMGPAEASLLDVLRSTAALRRRLSGISSAARSLLGQLELSDQAQLGMPQAWSRAPAATMAGTLNALEPRGLRGGTWSTAPDDLYGLPTADRTTGAGAAPLGGSEAIPSGTGDEPNAEAAPSTAVASDAADAVQPMAPDVPSVARRSAPQRAREEIAPDAAEQAAMEASPARGAPADAPELDVPGHEAGSAPGVPPEVPPTPAGLAPPPPRVKRQLLPPALATQLPPRTLTRTRPRLRARRGNAVANFL